MKNIVQVVQHLRPGGIETLALDMLNHLHERNNCYLVSLEGDYDTAVSHWPRLAAYKKQLIFLNKNPGFSLSTVFKLIKVFKKCNISAVHSHHIGPLIYAGIAARVCGIKSWVHTEHDAWHLSDKKNCKLQSRMLRNLKPTYVADARFVAKIAKQKLQLSDPQVIMNGVDTQRFCPGDKEMARSALGLNKTAIYIGTAGRLEKVKGHDVLIRALRMLPNHYSLLIAGIGSEYAALNKLVKDLGLADRVIFLGQVDSMPTFYRALDLFCLPSRNEGLPLAPLEAQACGTKTVLTNTGGSLEALCPLSGVSVTPEDSFGLKDALVKTMNKVCVSNPRDFVLKHGRFETMVKQYQALLNI